MRSPIQQSALLGGAFLLTLALLMSGWMLVNGAGAPAATATPGTTAPSATRSTAAGATATPPPASPTPSRTPWNWNGVTPAPLRTPQPTIKLPPASAAPGATVVYRLDGSAYVESVVPDGARLSRVGTSVKLDTNESNGEPVWVTWRLSPDQLPTGAVIVNVDARICGYGEGDFWEVYGPDGSEPFEYEVVPPDADGCWSFSGAPGHDLSVVAGVMLRSRLTIEAVEYTITFGQ